MNVGYTPKSARVRSGLSTNAVASKLKKSRNWLYLIEGGYRNLYLEDAQKLFEVYGMADIPLNQIFLSKKLSKSAKHNSKSLTSAKRKRGVR